MITRFVAAASAAIVLLLTAQPARVGAVPPCACGVRATMWGPSELYATGSLKTYGVTPRLHLLRMPGLFTCGRFDEATPVTVASFQHLVPNARLAIFERARI